MGTYAFGAAAGHALVADALAEGTRRAAALVDRNDVSDLEVLRSTGPHMLSSVYHEGRLAGKYGDVDLVSGDAEMPFKGRARVGGERALAHSWTARRRRRATHDHETYDEPSPAPTGAAPTEMMEEGSPTVVVASSVVFAGVDVATWSVLDDAIFASAVTSAVAAVASEDQISEIAVAATSSRRRRRLHFATNAQVSFAVTLIVDTGDATESTEVWKVVSQLLADLRKAVTTDANGFTPLDAAIAAAAVTIHDATIDSAAIDSASSVEHVSMSTYTIFVDTHLKPTAAPTAASQRGGGGSSSKKKNRQSKKTVQGIAINVLGWSIGAFILSYCCCRDRIRANKAEAEKQKHETPQETQVRHGIEAAQRAQRAQSWAGYRPSRFPNSKHGRI